MVGEQYPDSYVWSTCYVHNAGLTTYFNTLAKPIEQGAHEQVLERCLSLSTVGIDLFLFKGPNRQLSVVRE